MSNETSTIELKDRLANLTPEQRAKLAERLAARQAEGSAKRLALPTPVADVAHRNDPFSLTDLQHAYLIGRSRSFDMGNLASKVYLELACVDLDLTRFRAAWRRLIDRHDVLRLVITDDHRQRVLAEPPAWDLTLIDLRGQTPAAVQARHKQIKIDILTDLRPVTIWPLFDLLVTELDERRSHIHFGLDLLNFDAGSIAVLMDELAQVYRDPAVALPPLTLTFRDYLQTESAIHETEYYRRSEKYWMDRADTFPPPPELPLARKPSEIVDTDLRFTRRATRLPAAQWSRIKQYAAKTGLTPTAVMLTCYTEALGLWSTTQHFSVNVPFFNRLPLHPQVNHIVGDFTTVELLEVDRRLGGSFKARAQRLHAQLLADLDHRYMDGVKLLRVLAQRRGGAFSHGVPIVLTSLFDHSYTASVSTIGTICESSVNQTSQVWVDVAVDEHEGDLVVRFETVDQLFPEGVGQGMLDAMLRLLTALATDDANWEREHLDFFPPDQAERRRLINQTDAPFPDTLLHAYVEDVARQRPDDLAIVSTRRSITYAELMRMSRQLGRTLRAAGARPDQPIAVVMDKGWEQIVGVYAALQAGAPYVPVDPKYPTDRIHHLLQRTGVTQVLTQSWIESSVSWPAGVACTSVDTVDLSGIDDTPLPAAQHPGNLAYVLYTSGSTGEPKGVMLEHRGVVNRMLDVNNRYGIGAGDRVIALTALQHDLSVYDIFGTLFAGGTIVVPDADGVRDPGHWLALACEHQINVWNSVPAFMEMMVHHAEHAVQGGETIPQSLRVVILAGDFIPVSLPDRLRALFRNAQVISSGGPTETTIWDIFYPVGRVDPSWKSIPYGKPMSNAHYYVMKDTLELCPDHVVGEMYIGGVGLARGYWGDDQKTRERFVTHPVTRERLYRSGDMGRLLPDGNIEIIGRADFQVKIRGFRVELGEIESILGRHDEVRDAAVMAVGDSAATKRLVAYVVPKTMPTAAVEPEAAPDADHAPRGLFGHVKEMQGRLSGAVSLFKQSKPGLTQLKNYLDPIAKVEFKTKRHGLRHDTAGKTIVPFELPGDAASRRAMYLARQSYRRFLQAPLDLPKLGQLLASLYQLPVDGLPFPKGRYPSAGSLYPVQPYLYVKKGRVRGLDEGCYYYDPSQHALVLLSTDTPIVRNDVPPANFDVFDSSAFVLVLFAKLGAIEPMYGDLSRQFCAIETGYMSQLLMEEAPKHGLGLCPSGSILSKGLTGMFRLDEDHLFMHALMGGGIDQAQQEIFQVLEGESAAPVERPETLETRLQKYLKERVPEYMVPSRFIMLPSMPLSANGKVNRQALPKQDEGESTGAPAAVPPSGATEQAILKIWQDVLKVESISTDSNFFDLGGNSIHVVQVHNKIKALKPDISIIDLFSNPTIASLAAIIGRDDSAGPDPGASRGSDRAEARKAMRRRR